jgi:hypothetical protein
VAVCSSQHAENTIDTTPYDDTKIQQWINTITEKVMEDLLGLNKPFKYVGGCLTCCDSS